MLKNELHDILLGLVYSWDSDPRARRILKIIQEYVSLELVSEFLMTSVGLKRPNNFFAPYTEKS